MKSLRFLKKKKGELVPGTIIKCESGGYIAYYEHRTDIIANGENEVDARKNLRLMYEIVKQHEQEDKEKPTLKLPPTFNAKRFNEQISV